ncbi:MAG: metallophosphoesterase family protein [Phycisphaerae bacterium]|nr:metallophosphoesterase family protein [Phycisphaerae bacterium]
MLIGILSDSHGHYERVRRAMELFDRLSIEHIVHCGDVGGPAVFDEMVGRDCTFVWGNTDEPSMITPAYLKAVGLRPPKSVPARVDLEGKRIAVFHGHEPGFESAPRQLDVDYIFHGHTHRASDTRFNGVRLINPGALCRASRYTVAVLDLSSDRLSFHELPRTDDR